MASQGLKLFALGMMDEVKSLGSMATAFGPTVGTDFGGGGPMAQNMPFDPSAMAGPPQAQQMPFDPSAMAGPPQAEPMGGMSMQDQFAGMLVSKGVDPVFAQGLIPNIGDESGWQLDIQEREPIRGRGGKGLIQLTGPRRDVFEAKYGPNGYTMENQAEFIAWETTQGPERHKYEKILREAGGDPRKAAAGIVKDYLRPADKYKEARAAKYLGLDGATKSSMGSTSQYGSAASMLPVDTSYMEDIEPVDPELEKRRYRGALIAGIGKGLGQISKGQEVDISGPLDAYHARAEQARERMQEIAMERRRQQEVLAQRAWQLQDQQTANTLGIQAEGRAEARDIRSDERQQGYKIAEEEREQARIEKQVSRAQDLYGDLLPNAGDYFRVGGQDAVNDAITRSQKVKDRLFTINQVDALADQYADDPTVGDAYRRAAEAMATDPTMSFKEAFDLFAPKDDPAAVREFEFMKGLDDAGRREYLEFRKAGRAEFNLGDKAETVALNHAFSELGKDRDALRAKEPAYRAYQQIADLIEAYPDGRLPTGAIENLTGDVRRYLEGLDLLSPDDELRLGLQQTINSLGSTLIGAIRIPGTGSTSDLEFAEFMKAVPNTAKSEIVNHIMTQAGINNYRYHDQVTNLKEEYIYKNHNTIGFDKYLQEKIQDGTVQATFYSASNLPAMQNAAEIGNLKAGDIIQDKNGNLVVIDQSGIDALLGSD